MEIFSASITIADCDLRCRSLLDAVYRKGVAVDREEPEMYSRPPNLTLLEKLLSPSTINAPVPKSVDVVFDVKCRSDWYVLVDDILFKVESHTINPPSSGASSRVAIACAPDILPTRKVLSSSLKTMRTFSNIPRSTSIPASFK